jgi:hypothetical protein
LTGTVGGYQQGIGNKQGQHECQGRGEGWQLVVKFRYIPSIRRSKKKSKGPSSAQSTFSDNVDNQSSTVRKVDKAVLNPAYYRTVLSLAGWKRNGGGVLGKKCVLQGSCLNQRKLATTTQPVNLLDSRDVIDFLKYVRALVKQSRSPR